MYSVHVNIWKLPLHVLIRNKFTTWSSYLELRKSDHDQDSASASENGWIEDYK